MTALIYDYHEIKPFILRCFRVSNKQGKNKPEGGGWKNFVNFISKGERVGLKEMLSGITFCW